MKRVLYEITEKEEFIELFGTEAYQGMEEGVDYLNKLISSGDLTLTENGTIYETNDDELVVQGGNVNKDIWKWYGCRVLRNHSRSKKLAANLSTLSNSCGMVSSGALLLEKLDPEPYSKAFLGGFAIGTSFGWGYIAQMSSSISNKNKKYGTIIKLTWAFYYEVESQTKTTTT